MSKTDANNYKQIKVTLKKSVIGSLPRHRATIEALGLKKINSAVVHKCDNAIKGMIDSVRHLLKVEEIK